MYRKSTCSDLFLPFNSNRFVDLLLALPSLLNQHGAEIPPDSEMAKKILVLGSGMVAKPCVDYLLRDADNLLTIGDSIEPLILSLLLATPLY